MLVNKQNLNTMDLQRSEIMNIQNQFEEKREAVRAVFQKYEEMTQYND